jgi:hypothetical protein
MRRDIGPDKRDERSVILDDGEPPADVCQPRGGAHVTWPILAERGGGVVAQLAHAEHAYGERGIDTRARH